MSYENWKNKAQGFQTVDVRHIQGSFFEGVKKRAEALEVGEGLRQALLLDCRVIQDPCSLIFLCREEVKQMATYAYRSISERQKIQSLWESGASVKEIAQDFDLSVSAIYTELKRGYDGTRLPDMRRRYDAELAQLTVQKSIERRGRKAAEA